MMWRVDPSKGTIAFGSGLHGWGFTLTKFASLYGKKFGVKKKLLMKTLWGENYFDPEAKKWVTDPISQKSGKKLNRAWCQYVFKPLRQLISFIMADKVPKYQKMIAELNIKLTQRRTTACSEGSGENCDEEVPSCW